MWHAMILKLMLLQVRSHINNLPVQKFFKSFNPLSRQPGLVVGSLRILLYVVGAKMVAIQWRFLTLCLIFARILPTASTITLSKFQPVTGFSEECTNTYNTPLSACTALDFADGRPCSQSCIMFLDTLTTTIQKACQGTKVHPDTLMGMFFTFHGTKSICPNAQGSTGADAFGQQNTASTTFTTSVTPLDSAPSAATSITTIPLSALTAALTTITTTVMPDTTDTPKKVKATNGDGGGTPFDITSSSHHNLRPMTLGPSIIVGFAILTCLI